MPVSGTVSGSVAAVTRYCKTRIRAPGRNARNVEFGDCKLRVIQNVQNSPSGEIRGPRGWGGPIQCQRTRPPASNSLWKLEATFSSAMATIMPLKIEMYSKRVMHQSLMD